MENYESLGTIGEGTYGVVLKCRHKTTGQIVAIKKFKESDDDEQVKKTALREIKVLKALKHENIVSLLEVFRAKGKLYLVFEFVEKTILEEIEKHPEGLESSAIKRLMWQLVRAIQFCHSHNIIHRDIKPENLLVSRNGVLKLCDFGFARPLAAPGAKYTEYVSTRWYRAPELLVGDVSYGKAVDVWSIGCMFAEITTGLPLFPGDSDIDQLYHIIKCLGHVTARQHELFRKNSLYVGVKLPAAAETEPLRTRFPQLDRVSLDFLHQTIQDEPLDRWTCAELLQHPFFESMGDVYEAELQDAIERDLNDAAAIRKKRTRKPPPSRNGGARDGSISNGIATGTSGISSGSVCGPLLSPTVSVKSTAFGDYSNGNAHGSAVLDPAGKTATATLKPTTFKPMIASTHFQPSGVSKDKRSVSPHVIISSTSGTGAKKSMHPGDTGSSSSSAVSGTGAYHLPTLHGAVSTTTTTASTVSAVGGDMSPYSYPKRLLVPAIAENQPISVGNSTSSSNSSNGSSALGMAVPPEHMAFIHQHASGRQSMTSHGYTRSSGAATNGLVYPYAFSNAGGSSGVPPKPPPPTSSYMRNPYLAPQTPLTTSHVNKRTPHVLKPTGGGSSGARQHSNVADAADDVYSPKRFGGGSNVHAVAGNKPHVKKTGVTTGAGAGTGVRMSIALDLTPQGIYVPPRTSHGTLRSTERTRSRRDQDGGRGF